MQMCLNKGGLKDPKIDETLIWLRAQTVSNSVFVTCKSRYYVTHNLCLVKNMSAYKSLIVFLCDFFFFFCPSSSSCDQWNKTTWLLFCVCFSRIKIQQSSTKEERKQLVTRNNIHNSTRGINNPTSSNIFRIR